MFKYKRNRFVTFFNHKNGSTLKTSYWVFNVMFIYQIQTNLSYFCSQLVIVSPSTKRLRHGVLYLTINLNILLKQTRSLDG